MNPLTTWLPQLAIAVLSLLSGLIAYRTARQHDAAGTGAAGARATPVPAVPTPPSSVVAPQAVPYLGNGYASILRDTLERLEWLRTENEALRRDKEALRMRLDDCEHARRTTAAAATAATAAVLRTRRPRARS